MAVYLKLFLRLLMDEKYRVRTTKTLAFKTHTMTAKNFRIEVANLFVYNFKKELIQPGVNFREVGMIIKLHIPPAFCSGNWEMR